jgi:post-segregation antitoxin (ccd killing protein)
MAKRNLTVQLDDETIEQARAVAARRGTSVSQLVAHQIEELVEENQRYEEAWAAAREAMAGAEPHGGRSWTREELYDR